MSRRIFRIYPALGVARVGDAKADEYFIGPEIPGVPANFDLATQAFGRFKVEGRIKRQAARFRVWECEQLADGRIVPRAAETVVGQDAVAAIEWSVHLANRKSSFFRVQRRARIAELTTTELRNPQVAPDADERARRLDLDCGPRWISGPLAGPVILDHPNQALRASIPDLGELRTDVAGRLLVLGGAGRTAQLDGARLAADIDNDGWFDDVGDGPVGAVLTLINPDGTTERVEATGAWVVVGPPDFAPAIKNLVTLHDVLWDLAVREPESWPLPAYADGTPALAMLKEQRLDWRSTGARFTAYRPSFTREIAPLLERALHVTFVHRPPGDPFHATLTRRAWADLGAPGNDDVRASIFRTIRDPDASVATAMAMPKAFGDEYVSARKVPLDDPRLANPRRFLSLTRTQYALLRQWAEGKFESDLTAPEPPSAQPITPEGLDRAALENCVGGALNPGIEVGWLVRESGAHVDPFRLELGRCVGGLPVRAGFLTQQMAVPWQADFRDCHREPVTDPLSGELTFNMWWSAQRPDEVCLAEPGYRSVPWLRPPQFLLGDHDPLRFEEMVAGWSRLGFVALAFEGRWLEHERDE